MKSVMIVAVLFGSVLGIAIPNLLSDKLTSLLDGADLAESLSLQNLVPCPESVDIDVPNVQDLSSLEDFAVAVTVDPSKCPDADGRKVVCTLRPLQIVDGNIGSNAWQCA